MLEIGIIGHFGDNDNYTDGQTVKTKEIYKALIEKYGNVSKFDTHNIGKNIIRAFFCCQRMLKKSDVIILIVSRRGYKVLAPLLVLINKFYKKKLMDIVIGGTRFEIYNKKFLKSIANQFDMIFVETQSMKEEYLKRNINKVKVLPNFKKINIKLNMNKKTDIFKVCTFSRVCKEKGIDDAIEAVKMANKKIGKNTFYLDIYGQVDQNYKDVFNNKLKELPEYIQYKGITNPSESTKVISDYDLLLFLTYWNGEGFPGTLIDAMAAGVPVIASDWNCNFEILTDKINAFKVKVNDIENVSSILINCCNNYEGLYTMKRNCNELAKKYQPNEAILPLTNEIEK